MEWHEMETELSILQNSPEMGAPEMSQFPARISLAMSYVPYQRFENLYDEGTAFTHGTLFKGLDFPFFGAKRPKRGAQQ